MSLVAWAVIGVLAGGLARRVVGAEPRGCIATMAIGIVGAFIGGGLYRLVRGDEVDVLEEFDLGSILVAFLGSCLLLLVLQAIEGRSNR